MRATTTLCLLPAALLAGCAYAPPKEPEKIHFPPITYVFPKDRNLSGSGLAALQFSPVLQVIRRDTPSELLSRKAGVSGDTITLTNLSFLTNRKGKFDEPGVDYRKFDEVGVEYTVRCSSAESETEIRATCALAGRNIIDKTAYGPGSRLDARQFSPDEAAAYLKNSVSATYTFEADSPFNSESVLANFHRQLQESPSELDGRDRITGKIFKATYLMTHQGREVRLFVQVYPYQNGSKAVVSMTVPGVPFTGDTIDFSRDIRAVRERIASIVNS